MPLDFSQTTFLLSCHKPENFPVLHKKEIAIVGRSNSGKSSLLNHVTDSKNLARVSSTPGKTQLINFFQIDNTYTLVDLPGYGFAKIDKETRKHWGSLMQTYLSTRKELQLLIMLLDIRRELSEEDRQMIYWADQAHKTLLFIFSKKDKIPTTQQKAAENTLLASLQLLPLQNPFHYLSYSIKEHSCKIALQKQLLAALRE